MGNATPEKWSKTPATNSSSDPEILWAELQGPETVNDSSRAEMAGIANLLDDQGGQKVLGGTSTAYTLTSNQDIVAGQIVDGLRIHAVFNVAPGANPTFSLNGTTAKSIYRASPGGLIKLQGNEACIDHHGIFEYDESLNAAAGAWVLLNPLPVFAPVALTYAATYAADLATFVNGTMTLTGNISFQNPTNATPGQSGAIRFVQDASGSRVITWGGGWMFQSGINPVLSSLGGSWDVLYYYVMTTTPAIACTLSTSVG